MHPVPCAALQLTWPRRGRDILSCFDTDAIDVYQVDRPAIAQFAMDHQRFGGEFSYHRMSWIKPNFLRMMSRAGWAQKQERERILAIRQPRACFHYAGTAGTASRTRRTTRAGHNAPQVHCRHTPDVLRHPPHAARLLGRTASATCIRLAGHAAAAAGARRLLCAGGAMGRHPRRHGRPDRPVAATRRQPARHSAVVQAVGAAGRLPLERDRRQAHCRLARPLAGDRGPGRGSCHPRHRQRRRAVRVPRGRRMAPPTAGRQPGDRIRWSGDHGQHHGRTRRCRIRRQRRAVRHCPQRGRRVAGCLSGQRRRGRALSGNAGLVAG
ncbi:DUF4291 family protein [uncultured Xanthomonas sp.]|uniref:DUF4291 family protein n=1 Tax=uncultured Xanthomonas sp. TaxID=152831 RepID=UPI0031BB3395